MQNVCFFNCLLLLLLPFLLVFHRYQWRHTVRLPSAAEMRSIVCENVHLESHSIRRRTLLESCLLLLLRVLVLVRFHQCTRHKEQQQQQRVEMNIKCCDNQLRFPATHSTKLDGTRVGGNSYRKCSTSASLSSLLVLGSCPSSVNKKVKEREHIFNLVFNYNYLLNFVGGFAITI